MSVPMTKTNLKSFHQSITDHKKGTLCFTKSLKEMLTLTGYSTPSMEMMATREKQLGKSTKRIPLFRFILFQKATFRKAVSTLDPKFPISITLYQFLGLQFYCDIFTNAKEEIKKVLNEDKDAVHLVLCGYPITPAHNQSTLSIGAAATFRFSSSGSYLMYICISTQVYKQGNWMSTRNKRAAKKVQDQFDEKPFRGKGIGKLVITSIQKIGLLINVDSTIYLHCNPGLPNTPLSFYRYHTFMLHIQVCPPDLVDQERDDGMQLHRSIGYLPDIIVDEAHTEQLSRRWRDLSHLVQETCLDVFRKNPINAVIGHYVIKQNHLVMGLLGDDVVLRDSNPEDDKFYEHHHGNTKKGRPVQVEATVAKTNEMVGGREFGSNFEVLSMDKDIGYGIKVNFILRFTLWRLNIVKNINDTEDPTLQSHLFTFIGLMAMRLSAVHDKMKLTLALKAALQSWFKLDEYQHLSQNNMSYVLSKFARSIVMGERQSPATLFSLFELFFGIRMIHFACVCNSDRLMRAPTVGEPPVNYRHYSARARSASNNKKVTSIEEGSKNILWTGRVSFFDEELDRFSLRPTLLLPKDHQPNQDLFTQVKEEYHRFSEYIKHFQTEIADDAELEHQKVEATSVMDHVDRSVNRYFKRDTPGDYCIDDSEVSHHIGPCFTIDDLVWGASKDVDERFTFLDKEDFPSIMELVRVIDPLKHYIGNKVFTNSLSDLTYGMCATSRPMSRMCGSFMKEYVTVLNTLCFECDIKIVFLDSMQNARLIDLACDSMDKLEDNTHVRKKYSRMKINYVGNRTSKFLMKMIKPGWRIVVAANVIQHYVTFHYTFPPTKNDNNDIFVCNSLNPGYVDGDISLSAQGLLYLIHNTKLATTAPRININPAVRQQRNLHDCGFHCILHMHQEINSYQQVDINTHVPEDMIVLRITALSRILRTRKRSQWSNYILSDDLETEHENITPESPAGKSDVVLEYVAKNREEAQIHRGLNVSEDLPSEVLVVATKNEPISLVGIEDCKPPAICGKTLTKLQKTNNPSKIDEVADIKPTKVEEEEDITLANLAKRASKVDTIEDVDTGKKEEENKCGSEVDAIVDTGNKEEEKKHGSKVDEVKVDTGKKKEKKRGSDIAKERQLIVETVVETDSDNDSDGKDDRNDSDGKEVKPITGLSSDTYQPMDVDTIIKNLSGIAKGLDFEIRPPSETIIKQCGARLKSTQSYYTKRQLQPEKAMSSIRKEYEQTLITFKKEISSLEKKLHNLPRRKLKKHQKMAKMFDLYNKKDHLLDQIGDIEKALKQEVLFIHPNSIPLLRKLSRKDSHGFSYEVGAVNASGELEFHKVSAAWVVDNFCQEYINEVNKHAEYEVQKNITEKKQFEALMTGEVYIEDDNFDESEFIWTDTDMADRNNSDQKRLMELSEEEFKSRVLAQKVLVNNSTTSVAPQQIGESPTMIVTWIKLIAKWVPATVKKQYELSNHTWHVSSKDYAGCDNDILPKYEVKWGDKAPLHLRWEDANENFLRTGFNDEIVDSLIKKSRGEYIANKKTVKKRNVIACKQIDCEKKACTYINKELQIMALMFDKDKKQFRGKYLVMFQDVPNNKTKQAFRTELLEKSWVDRNFNKEFIEEVKCQSEKEAKRCFVVVPPGKSCNKRKKEILDDKLPIIRYPQCNDNTCLTSSLGSAFCYLGLNKLAEVVINFGVNSVCTSTLISEVNLFLMKQKEFSDRWIVVALPQNYDLFDNIKEKGPKVIRILDSWGCISHVVTIVDGMIFDSNKAYAMMLTYSNLNACCVGNENAIFTTVHSGYHYLPRKRIVNRFTKKRRRMDK